MFWHVPSAEPLNVMTPAVGDNISPEVSVTLVLLISHGVPVHSLITSAFGLLYLPNRSTNDALAVSKGSNLAASRDFQASQPDFSTAIMASTFGSATGAALEFEFTFELELALEFVFVELLLLFAAGDEAGAGGFGGLAFG